MNTLLRKIKKVDKIAALPEIKFLYDTFSSTYILEVIKKSVAMVKEAIKSGALTEEKLIDSTIVHNILLIIANEQRPHFKKVLNCTGTVLHTNLGRAKLSQKAIDNLLEVAGQYSNLEYNLEEGIRGSRYDHLSSLLSTLTSCEDAIVVNNNAAAVMLVLSTLSKGKETVISRGELVEIGGSFRIPKVMEFGGAIQKEIGTTNKTHLADYEDNISKDTGLIIKVHRSNYVIKGFTKEVDTKELVALAKRKKVPLYYDLGSGSLYDFKIEPTVKELIEQGVDLLSFSGDKLLGGPQAGIIVGKKKLIAKLKKNQLLRAIRVDKLTLAALEGTLIEYLDSENVRKNNPTVRMLSYTLPELEDKALELAAKFASLKDESLVFSIKKINSLSGGGSLPDKKFPSYALALEDPAISLKVLINALKINSLPIIVRTKDNALLLDVRTIDKEDFGLLVEEFYSVYRSLKS
ncbi:MAG: L-seryl-tRNA(Sec) selenium transferase [Fusobacteria bacterium]|nr:L-seryl-tRNA(Sec) selenium transferase [Fusobacteriota bacterium]